MIDLKWLRSLKKGDEVVIVAVNYGNCPFSLHKIDVVTPSGNIFAGGKEFSLDGYEGSRTASDYGRDHIIQPTTEIIQTIESIKVRDKIKNWIQAKLNNVSLDELNKIWKVLNGIR
jgi:hypothetical protein